MATFYKVFETSHSLRAARFWFCFELELVVKWFSSPLVQADKFPCPLSVINLHRSKYIWKRFSRLWYLSINIVWTIDKNSEFSFCFQIFVVKFGSRKIAKFLIFDISSIYFILRLLKSFVYILTFKLGDHKVFLSLSFIYISRHI